jgi:hypothetical protein
MATRREATVSQRLSGRLILLLGFIWRQLVPLVKVRDVRWIRNQVSRLGIEVQVEANGREPERTEGSS